MCEARPRKWLHLGRSLWKIEPHLSGRSKELEERLSKDVKGSAHPNSPMEVSVGTRMPIPGDTHILWEEGQRIAERQLQQLHVNDNHEPWRGEEWGWGTGVGGRTHEVENEETQGQRENYRWFQRGNNLPCTQTFIQNWVGISNNGFRKINTLIVIKRGALPWKYRECASFIHLFFLTCGHPHNLTSSRSPSYFKYIKKNQKCDFQSFKHMFKYPQLPRNWPGTKPDT